MQKYKHMSILTIVRNALCYHVCSSFCLSKIVFILYKVIFMLIRRDVYSLTI